MSELQESLIDVVGVAIERVADELQTTVGLKNIHGFALASKRLFEEVDRDHTSDDEWGMHRDARFRALSAALARIRKQRIFNEETFLTLGSTDPSDHMEVLEWREIKQYNTQRNLDEYLASINS